MEEDFKAAFEKTADCHKTILVEAAHKEGRDADAIWINMCSLYRYPKGKEWELRDYVRSHYPQER
jgi:hypothetical protein